MGGPQSLLTSGDVALGPCGLHRPYHVLSTCSPLKPDPGEESEVRSAGGHILVSLLGTKGICAFYTVTQADLRTRPFPKLFLIQTEASPSTGKGE